MVVARVFGTRAVGDRLMFSSRSNMLLIEMLRACLDRGIAKAGDTAGDVVIGGGGAKERDSVAVVHASVLDSRA
jgi:hypothetical protein